MYLQGCDNFHSALFFTVITDFTDACIEFFFFVCQAFYENGLNFNFRLI